MGKGSGTKQNNVKKSSQNFSKDPAVVSAGGTISRSEADSCLFSFEATIQSTNMDNQIETGMKVTLVPGSGSKEFSVMSGATIIGILAHPVNEKLFACIEKGFIYKGEVTSVISKNEFKCLLQGYGET